MKNMYPCIFLLAGMLICSFLTFTQTNPKEGDVLINPYYGAPNFGKTLAKNANININGQEVIAANETASGIGPVGVRGGYMINDNVFFGLDFIYNDFSLDYRYSHVNDQGNEQIYYGTIEMKRVRVHARFNYMFNTSSFVFKPYVGLGFGFNGRFLSVVDNGQEIVEELVSGIPINIIPFSGRLAFGSNFYLTNHVAINAELGLGGPLVSAGLTFNL